MPGAPSPLKDRPSYAQDQRDRRTATRGTGAHKTKTIRELPQSAKRAIAEPTAKHLRESLRISRPLGTTDCRLKNVESVLLVAHLDPRAACLT